MQRKNTAATVIFAFMFLFPFAARAQQKVAKGDAKHGELPAVIWRDPGEVTKLDLIDGFGGKKTLPIPPRNTSSRKKICMAPARNSTWKTISTVTGA